MHEWVKAFGAGEGYLSSNWLVSWLVFQGQVVIGVMDD